MKRTLLLMALTWTAVQSFAQTVNLKKGERLEYMTSDFNQISRDENFPDKRLGLFGEHYYKNKIVLDIIESNKKSYIIQACKEQVKNYVRSKKDNESSWVSNSFFYKSLVKDTTNNTTTPIPYWQFKLSKSGKVSELTLLDSATHNYPRMLKHPWMVTEKYFEKYFIPSQKIGANSKEVKIEEQTWDILTNSEDQVSIKLENEKKYFVKTFDPQRGILINEQSFSIIDIPKSYDPLKPLSPGKFMNRTQLIDHEPIPFQCSFSKNKQEKDTTFFSTNVSITGRITDPEEKRLVFLKWNERKPNRYNRYQIKVPLREDNTFEIRLQIDQLTSVELIHGKKAKFYLLPGNDVDITLDTKNFNQTIQATGLGAENINYMFAKYLVEKKNGSFQKSLSRKMRQTMVNMTLEQAFDTTVNLITKKQEYINSQQHLLAPEIYLAEYWNTHIENMRNFNSKFLSSRDKYLGQIERLDLHKFSQADNDLMSFASGYQYYIKTFSIYILGQQIRTLTGIGYGALANQTQDGGQYLNEYSIAHSSFSGWTQHLLKYLTVLDAMNRGDWSVFEQLHSRFQSEYPNSIRAQWMKEAYQKANKVKPGSLAYDFELENMNGKKVKLSDFRGKPVFIQFWRSDCCSNYLDKQGKEIADFMAKNDIQLLFISLDRKKDKVMNHTIDEDLKKHILLSTEKSDLLREKFYFNSYTEQILIDSEGRLLKKSLSPFIFLKHPQALLSRLEPG
ncbi:peroxiredoxin family protein [Reichenbachiella versicolor]|uniref:peroxiredoxin family protein n=1 Tax=Reichenbachiella versicolor TaxID=1821036 RepID=UPI000D6E358C|nr:redoxin domain-containing protein [Reichenbachiella versicolor]